MKQNIPTPISDLLALAGVIHIGVTTYGATVPLLHNTGLAFGADLNAVLGARDNHEEGKMTLAEKMAMVDSIMETGHQQLVIGRDMLKPHLGYQHNSSYAAIGLNKGTAAVPRTIEGVQSTLAAYKGFFEANAALENVALDITAAHYESLYDQLLAARGAVNVQKKNVDDLMQVRDEKADQLRKRIRWVINEMEPVVNPTSSLWTAFGLNKPGAETTPDKVEGVQVSLLGSAATVRWQAAARAGHYRVWTRINGSGAEYVAVGSPADLDINIENLPANSTIDLVVTAVNGAGESAFSDVITFTTHA